MDIPYYRRLKNVNRLGVEAILRPYNLLEHSYMVTVLFMHFAAKEGWAYGISCIDHILHHDILETVTGDLPYVVKRFSSTTLECWSKIEEEIVGVHPQLITYTDDYMERTLTPGQLELFKVCDLLDLWIFLKEEQGLGNTNARCQEIINTCVTLIKGKFKSVDQFMNDYKF